MNDKSIDYSVVIPVYNEEKNILEIHRRLFSVFKEITENYEILFINDGSKDGSLEIIQGLSQKDGRIKFLDFSRNFGHQMAITAGMDYSSGKAIIIIDCDLQDPPELIPKLIEEWKRGFEVVYAIRKKREGETFFKKITANIFYRLFLRATNINMPLDTGDFRLVDRKVVEGLKTIREKHRFIRGLISWIGYKQVGVSYDRAKRTAGKTKFPFLKMLKFSLDGLTSFSLFPLRLAIVFGFAISTISFAAGAYFLALKVFTDKLIQGWMTLAVSVLFLGGIQLIILGIIGEYIGRIYEETKNRPLYLIREAGGLDKN